jgi:riboflavin biosynthesis pyrimidine reductase
MLRLLLPGPSARVNLFELYSREVRQPGDRPFVRVNMVSTLDGAVAFAGRSGHIGGATDRLLFSVLRSLADVVLVGAGTVRAERYGPVKLPAEAQQMRLQSGQGSVPTIAVVTRSGVIDWESPLFAEGAPRPIVITTAGTATRVRTKGGARADVVSAGTETVDLAVALRALGERRLARVLCEGGPALNSGLAAAQLIDELCLTLSPKLAGWTGPGPLSGWMGREIWPASGAVGGASSVQPQPLPELLELQLAHVLEDDGSLFLRLRAGYRTGSPEA